MGTPWQNTNLENFIKVKHVSNKTKQENQEINTGLLLYVTKAFLKMWVCSGAEVQVFGIYMVFEMPQNCANCAVV